MIEIKATVLPQGNTKDRRNLFTLHIWTLPDNTKHKFALFEDDPSDEGYVLTGTFKKEYSAHQNLFHVLKNIFWGAADKFPKEGSNYIKRGGHKPYDQDT